ncbi:hypothetical protein EMIT0111MI5_120095 [Burkholderia sp. IT-111MI5]
MVVQHLSRQLTYASAPASKTNDLSLEEFHGRLHHRLAEPRAAMAARHRRHRVDRRVVLFRRARQQPETADRPEPAQARRVRRTVARPRRRLLQHAEVHGRPAGNAG